MARALASDPVPTPSSSSTTAAASERIEREEVEEKRELCRIAVGKKQNDGLRVESCHNGGRVRDERCLHRFHLRTPALRPECSSDSQSAVFEIQLRFDQGPSFDLGILRYIKWAKFTPLREPITKQFKANEHPEHMIRGLEPVAVAAIPTIKYCREAFHPKEDAQCSVCLGEYEDKDMIRVMPICRHNFHMICIDVWLRKHSTCPICRLPLNTHEERHESPFSTSLPSSRGGVY